MVASSITLYSGLMFLLGLHCHLFLPMCAYTQICLCVCIYGWIDSINLVQVIAVPDSHCLELIRLVLQLLSVLISKLLRTCDIQVVHNPLLNLSWLCSWFCLFLSTFLTFRLIWCFMLYIYLLPGYMISPLNSLWLRTYLLFAEFIVSPLSLMIFIPFLLFITCDVAWTSVVHDVAW